MVSVSWLEQEAKAGSLLLPCPVSASLVLSQGLYPMEIPPLRTNPSSLGYTQAGSAQHCLGAPG